METRALRRCLWAAAPAVALALTLGGAQELQFGERIDVEVIDLEVVVIGPDGIPVTDLRKDDFTVSVNGEPAGIVDFAAHFDAVPAPVSETRIAAMPAPQAAPSPTPSARSWLVFVDLARLNHFRRTIAVRDLQKFFRTSVDASDPAMVGYFDGWALRMLQLPTGRAATVPKVLEPLAASALPPSREMLDFELTEEEVTQKRLASMRALRDFAMMASGLEGRLTMLFLGAGYEFGDPGSQMYARLTHEYEKLRDSLASSDITVNSLYGWRDGAIEFGAHVSYGDEGMPAIDSGAPDMSGIPEGSTMAAIAADTGGTSLTATTGLRERLEQSESRRNGYYALAVRTPSNAAGRRLDIRVRVAREGLRVQHRRTMRIATDEETTQRVSMTALLTEKPKNPWNVKVRVGRLHRDITLRHRAPLEIRIPASALLFLEREGRHHAHLQFFLSVKDVRGNYTSIDPRELRLDVTDAELQALRSRGIRYNLELVVSAGTTDVALTVADALARTHSTAHFEVVAAGRVLNPDTGPNRPGARRRGL